MLVRLAMIMAFLIRIMVMTMVLRWEGRMVHNLVQVAHSSQYRLDHHAKRQHHQQCSAQERVAAEAGQKHPFQITCGRWPTQGKC